MTHFEGIIKYHIQIALNLLDYFFLNLLDYETTVIHKYGPMHIYLPVKLTNSYV